jgi:hypothetical protein
MIYLQQYKYSKCDPTGIRTQIKGTGILHSIHLTMGPFLKTGTKIAIFSGFPLQRTNQAEKDANNRTINFIPGKQNSSLLSHKGLLRNY